MDDIKISTDQYLGEIIEHLPDPTFVINLEGKVIAWNKAIVEMTKVKAEDILGKGDYEYAIPFYGERRPVLIDFAIRKDLDIDREGKYDFVKRENDTLIIEVHISRLNPGGTYLWCKATPLYDSNHNIVGSIETFRDITDRKIKDEKIKQLNMDLVKSNKKYKKLSLCDPHTGLFNYNYLQEIIESELFRAKRYAHPLSVIMLDIDYFKSINDVYGRQFGDLVLKQFAHLLKSLLRKYDIIIRSGGEEFIILSPGLDRATSLVLANRLQDAISLYNFGNKKQTVKLKLSMSVVSYPEDKISAGKDMIVIADQILSKVKESGGSSVFTTFDVTNCRSASPDRAKKTVNEEALEEKIEKLTRRSNQSLIEAVYAFAKTIELKDHYTGEHVERTVHYAVDLARAIGLSREEVERIHQAAMLHDLGKIGISENILLKPAKLTKKEFAEIKKHPQIAVDIIRPIQFLHSVIPYILYHHERWDGKGYPNGLKGDEIPLGARIIAIADVFQALISHRPYREKAYSKKDAVAIIESASGTQFDPNIVKVFSRVIQNID